ncbi:MAG: hypothetical protein ABI378_12665 [Chitinophagaceae bacterium]
MKRKELNHENAPKTELTADDRTLLRFIYSNRLRTIVLVFSSILAFLLIYSLPYFWRGDLKGEVGAIIAIIILCLGPAAVFFWKFVWPYKRDLKADFKYTIHEEVIRKEYFENTGQYFLALDDVKYLHHEVDADTYARVKVGDLYPVFFAPYSRYPFTLRGRVTMM